MAGLPNNPNTSYTYGYSGDLFFDGNGLTTSFSQSDTYVDINVASWTLNSASYFFQKYTDDQSLQFTNRGTIRTFIYSDIHLEGTSSNQDYYVGIFKNGSLETEFEVLYKNTPLTVGHSTLVLLDKDDYITLKIKNSTSTAGAIISHAELDIIVI